MPFVLMDPNWGDPKPVKGTEADNYFEALEKAISPNCMDARLYGLATPFPLPDGRPGDWERMQKQGYEIKFVESV